MIITKLLGGLGNQLFQYAVGRALASKLNVPLKIHKYDFNLYSLRPFALDAFNISAMDASNDDVARIIQQNPHSGEESERKFLPEILDSTDNTYLRGDWQCENYFKDIEDIIRKDFSLKNPLSKDAAKWAKKIESAKDSLSIHIRRGDYERNPSVRKNFGVLPKEYYQNAIDELKKQGVKFRAFVFSDDVDWVKKNLDLGVRAEFIKGVKHDYEELALMSLCKNHIIANSSFGWWGAWLDPNPDKIVIAPDPWFRASVGNKDIVPKNWIKVPSFLDVIDAEKAKSPVVTAVLIVANDAAHTDIALKTLIGQQSFEGDDLEIIAIANDADKDALETAENLLRDRENARIIETSSLAPAKAYNMGLQEAKGEYVTFIGGRDCLAPTAVSVAFSMAENYKADALAPIAWYMPNVAGDAEFFGNKFQTVSEEEVSGTFLLDPNAERRIELLGAGKINPSLTGKLFRKSFLTEKEIAFNESLTHGEDIEFIFCVLGLGSKYVKTPFAGRISLGVAPHDKETCEEEFRAYLEAVNSHLSGNPKAVRERITGIMAVLYLKEHFEAVFVGEDFAETSEKAIAVAREFGISISAEKKAEPSDANSILQKLKNMTKQAEDMELALSRIEEIIKQKGE